MTRTVLTRADARTVAFRAAANQARNKNPVTQAGAQAVAVPFRGDIEKAQAAYTAAGCVAAIVKDTRQMKALMAGKGLS